MDKYYFDLGTVWAVIIALIGSVVVMSLLMIDNINLRREINDAYDALEKNTPPFQVVCFFSQKCLGGYPQVYPQAYVIDLTLVERLTIWKYWLVS